MVARRRDWAAAHDKVRAEGNCRACHLPAQDPAHIVPRSRIGIGMGGEDPRNVVPLCRRCHGLYDEGALDLLPVLSLVEQAYAVELVGLEEARRRITNERAA